MLLLQATLSHIFSEEVGAKKCLWTNMRQVSQRDDQLDDDDYISECVHIYQCKKWMKIEQIMWSFASFPRSKMQMKIDKDWYFLQQDSPG